LQPANRQFGFRRQVSTLAGLLTVFIVLGCGFLSASPSLHRLVHADADSADHSCIVTLFTKGQLLPSPEIQIFIGLALLFGGSFMLAETFAFCPADYRVSSSRAPPRFLV
jgi:hypothetical protein